MGRKKARRAKQRRRIKTVIQELVYLAGRFIRHAQDQAKAFAQTYDRFGYG